VSCKFVQRAGRSAKAEAGAWRMHSAPQKGFPGSQSQGMRGLIGLSHCRTFLRVFMKRCAVDIDWGSEQAAGLKLLHTRLGTIAIEQRCDDESSEDGVRSILAKKLRMAMVVRRAIRGDALKYWKWPPYRNCTIHEHQQKMQILTYTSNNVKYI